MKDVFIFIGPPGAGKGSLSQLCVKELGWQQLSTGALCRKHIAEETEIGKQIDFAIKSGKLISDKLMIEMVEEWLNLQKKQAEAVILDGFPRTLLQAQALQMLLQEKFPQCGLKIIKLNLSQESIVQRLAGRFVCQNQDCQVVYSLIEGSGLAPKRPSLCDVCSSPLMKRLDDTVTSIIDRLAVYQMHEKGLLDFYSSHGHYINEVEVEKPLDQVFADLKKYI